MLIKTGNNNAFEHSMVKSIIIIEDDLSATYSYFVQVNLKEDTTTLIRNRFYTEKDAVKEFNRLTKEINDCYIAMNTNKNRRNNNDN